MQMTFNEYGPKMFSFVQWTSADRRRNIEFVHERSSPHPQFRRPRLFMLRTFTYRCWSFLRSIFQCFSFTIPSKIKDHSIRAFILDIEDEIYAWTKRAKENSDSGHAFRSRLNGSCVIDMDVFVTGFDGIKLPFFTLRLNSIPMRHKFGLERPLKIEFAVTISRTKFYWQFTLLFHLVQ